MRLYDAMRLLIQLHVTSSIYLPRLRMIGLGVMKIKKLHRLFGTHSYSSIPFAYIQLIKLITLLIIKCIVMLLPVSARSEETGTMFIFLQGMLGNVKGADTHCNYCFLTCAVLYKLVK